MWVVVLGGTLLTLSNAVYDKFLIIWTFLEILQMLDIKFFFGVKKKSIVSICPSDYVLICL